MSKDAREGAARAKLRELLGAGEDEFGPTLSRRHHKEDLSSEHRQSGFEDADPTPKAIVKDLVRVDSLDSGDNGTIETYDFDLAGEVTNYLLSVRFPAMRYARSQPNPDLEKTRAQQG